MGNTDIPQPVDVGLGQFTASLISETLNAVIAANLEQEERIRALHQVAGYDLQRFAEEVISSDQVEMELSRLFPTEEGPHGVAVGAPYLPPAPGQDETPPIQRLTGYVMQEGDWEMREGGLFITTTGSQRVFERIKLELAERQLANMVGLIRRGVPRVVVDQGRINTKLTFAFSTTSDGDSTASSGVSTSLASSAGLTARSLIQTAAPRLPLKLTVRPADLKRPEIMRLSVNVVGEVEITFKTVSD